MCRIPPRRALVIVAASALLTSGCQTGASADREQPVGAFAWLDALAGREFTDNDVFVRGLWRFDGILCFEDGYRLGCIQDRDAGCLRFVSLHNEGDAWDLYARITAAPVPVSSDLSTRYQDSLREMRTYVMSNDRPRALPEDPTLYDGPLSSVEAERTVRWLQGKVLDDRAGIVGGGKWVVCCRFEGDGKSPKRLAHVYLEPKLPTGTFSILILNRHQVPVWSEGDVADLYHRVTGKRHPKLKDWLSADYKTFLEGENW